MHASDATPNEHDPTPASLICRLWIGPTSSVDQGDLSYNAPWPIPAICNILARCPSLHSLALMNAHQKCWPRLSLAIPRAVRALWIGPVHGKADWRYLPCAPSAREFLTMDTYMTQDELRQIVLSPSIRRVRRFFSSPVGVGLYTLDQLACVEQAPWLESFELVCCSATKEEAAVALEEAVRVHGYEPTARVVLTPRSNMHGGRRDPLALLFEDWVDATCA
ncbi:hypothetical protein C8Q77DRAFT_865963 [Trametes polyzona]|nr:hypothetical protein C8Q77DRAFT_865963 [Trametes polyzona]